MTASYLGSYTIGASMPGAAAVATAGAGGINVALPGLLEQLEGLLSFSPSPISIAAQIGQLNTMIKALQAQLLLGVEPPSLALQMAGIADLIASLQANVSLMQAGLSVITQFQALLAEAGVHLISFAGPASAFGAEVGALVATLPGISSAHALVLVTDVAATWSALSQIMKVST
jgi:hypothetical protein